MFYKASSADHFIHHHHINPLPIFSPTWRPCCAPKKSHPILCVLCDREQGDQLVALPPFPLLVLPFCILHSTCLPLVLLSFSSCSLPLRGEEKRKRNSSFSPPYFIIIIIHIHIDTFVLVTHCSCIMHCCTKFPTSCNSHKRNKPKQSFGNDKEKPIRFYYATLQVVPVVHWIFNHETS